MLGRSFNENDIALMLRSKNRLAPFIQAIEAQDSETVAKHLRNVLPDDDGTIRDLYLRDPALLVVLKSHL